MQKLVQDTGKLLAGRVFKQFTFDEIIQHHQIPYKNIYEMICKYPNSGVNFKIWRRTWPAEKYVIITQSYMKGLRTGRIYGIEYWKGKPQTDTPIRIRGGNKRGVWHYDVNGSSAMTDNNCYYSAEVLRQFMEMHSFRYKYERAQENLKSEKKETKQQDKQ